MTPIVGADRCEPVRVAQDRGEECLERAQTRLHKHLERTITGIGRRIIMSHGGLLRSWGTALWPVTGLLTTIASVHQSAALFAQRGQLTADAVAQPKYFAADPWRVHEDSEQSVLEIIVACQGRAPVFLGGTCRHTPQLHRSATSP